MTLDLLVVGGGPVGLITALQLARNLPSANSRIRIIEKAPKDAQEATGRAITLFPRSSELLGQLDLADELAQQCFACHETVSYRDGVEVKGRGWSFMEGMRGTTWDFALVLRQKFQEDVFRKALLKEKIELEAGVELLELSVDESISVGSHRIKATIKDIKTGHVQKVRSRYLVGADGGRSFVRRARWTSPSMAAHQKINGSASTASSKQIFLSHEHTVPSNLKRMEMFSGQRWIAEQHE
jgi:phenol 2-monooxygenase